MVRVPRRALSWWAGLDDHQRRLGSALGLIGSISLLHYLVYTIAQPFFIEDAGISFAYARNLAEGEGLVSYAGGERVEGYSNALWVFLLAAFHLVGINPWVSSKLLGAALGLLALPLAFGLTRRALADIVPLDSRRLDGLALLAPLILALSQQIVLWNASGLENALFGLLLLAGAWRGCVEQEREAAGGYALPLSAFFFFLLTMTRPEGMMYAAAGLGGRVVSAALNRRPRAVLELLLAFALPYALYNGWRYLWFAWPYPNTYYGKLGAGTMFQPFTWDGRGWKQIQQFFQTHYVVYALPLLPLAMTGLRGARRWAGLFIIAWLALVVLWDGRAGLPSLPAWYQDVPQRWVHLRVWSLLAGGVLLGLLGLGRPGWLARGQLWAFFCGGIFFVVYGGNDWMKAFRWFNLIGVSMFPLLVVGFVVLVDELGLLERKVRAIPAWLLGAAPLLVAFTVIQSLQAADFVAAPETSVRDIRRRVDYMSGVQRALDLDQVTLLDVDMGAHMYFSDWRILDIAGLIEIPMARHRKFERAFIRHYIFEEERPHFGHVHGNWARSSRIDTHSEWKQGYIEIPGYPIGNGKLHIGNHVRKDLFVTKGEAFPGAPKVIFEGGVRLAHLDLPSPQVAQGGELFVHLVFTAPMSRQEFEVEVFLDAVPPHEGNGHQTSAVVKPAYGWLPVEDWKRDEQVHTRYRMPLPADLPPGEYRIGIVLHSSTKLKKAEDADEDDDKDGEKAAEREEAEEEIGQPPRRVRPLLSVDGTTPSGEPVHTAGEYLPQGLTVRILPPGEAQDLAEAGVVEATRLAQAGDCDGGWDRFKNASRVLLADLEWREEQEEPVRTALALCELEKARAADDEEDRIAALLRARRWDHRAPGLTAMTRPEAATLRVEGDTWREKKDWERSYRSYALALKLDPRLSHVRRAAEEVRDRMLGIRKD